MDTKTQETQETHLPRNTSIRGRLWGPCTWNNYSEVDFEKLVSYCRDKCQDFAINKEIGEEGTPHLQFCMKFKNAKEFTTLKNQFPACHLEKAKNWGAVKNYCTKAETSICEAVTPCTRRPLKDPLEGKEPKEFQKFIMDLVDTEADDRTINWIYDPVGCAGKTTLAKHLCINHPGKILYVSGKAADIKYGVTSFLDNEINDLYLLFIDLTRSVENFVSYEAIEAVKNGIFYNTKYESKMIVFNSPHVVVLANFEPELEKLSADRWNIIEL